MIVGCKSVGFSIKARLAVAVLFRYCNALSPHGKDANMRIAIRTWLVLAAMSALLGGGCAAFDEFHPDDDAEDYGYTAEQSPNR